MRIPEQPAVTELKHLSPSLYEAARLCKARAAWLAFGARDGVPSHPQALLGICVHAVVEEAHSGRFAPWSEDSLLVAARNAFDHKAQELHEAAHPLLRVKFATPERIPYYYLSRERAAVLALDTAPRPNAAHAPALVPGSGASSTAPGTLVETTLRSRDGLLLGRPDFVDPTVGEVVDYKTGAGRDDDPDGLSDTEVRQLRFYIHLGRERGLELRRGVVVRAGGRRVALNVTDADASEEGRQARDVLASFNARASEGFKDLAEPSPDACRYCPCVPFCESFWGAVTSSWLDACGTQVEGTILAANRAVVHNTALVTLELAVTRGSVASGAAVVQHVPEAWACADASPPPQVGDLVRVVNARLVDDGGESALIRPDRLTTAIWTVRPAADAQ